MRRRDFLGVTGAAAVLGPLAAHAQQAKMPIVGILVVGAPSSGRFRRIFREEMRKLGYLQGQNIRFEFRSDHGNAASLPELAAELVRLGANVIVAWFTPAASAAKQATREIPIVMAAAGDPVATGLVESLARPGGNVTGISGMSADLAGKCVGLMRQMLPSARRMAALANAPDPFSKPFLAKIRLAGEAIGTAIDPILIQRPDQLDAAFAAMTAAWPEAGRPEGLIVQPSLPIEHVAELALKHRVPAASPFRPFAEDGGLMSYWVNEVYTYRRVAVFVDKILKGAKPADLPVEQPTRFWLVINLKTAKALGLTVPQ
jgi:putative tryptophan/tyrosine transport system substrate-binding protein